VSAPPGPISEVDLFRDRKSVTDFNAEIPDGAFNLGVPEQELHGTQVSRVRFLI
jgi:hypothetical protein